jgi:hypothetical protein
VATAPAAFIALRLPADELVQVARFVANERKCCTFLRVELDIAPGAGSMWLRLTGPQGTRELLEAELGLKTRPPVAATEAMRATP